MIKGIWNMIEVYCGDKARHEVCPQLEVVQGVYNGYFYNCPNYKDENRKPGERKCCNRISPVEYEKMIDHVSKLLEEATLNSEQINLAGYKWKNKGILFEVFEHTDDKIKIYMLNPKEVK